MKKLIGLVSLSLLTLFAFSQTPCGSGPLNYSWIQTFESGVHPCETLTQFQISASNPIDGSSSLRSRNGFRNGVTYTYRTVVNAQNNYLIVEGLYNVVCNNSWQIVVRLVRASNSAVQALGTITGNGNDADNFLYNHQSAFVVPGENYFVEFICTTSSTNSSTTQRVQFDNMIFTRIMHILGDPQPTGETFPLIVEMKYNEYLIDECENMQAAPKGLYKISTATIQTGVTYITDLDDYPVSGLLLTSSGYVITVNDGEVTSISTTVCDFEEW